jgi:cell division septation protein DedD
MKGASKTRTQRRMEKRQAVILLVLVLAVSLASFTLGVIVGRRGAERDLAQKQRHVEKVLVAPVPVPTTPSVTPPAEKKQPVSVSEEKKETPKLSFYDDLGKETVPLGSGINLPPAEEKPTKAAQPPIDLPDHPIAVKKETPVTRKAEVEKPVPAVAEKTVSKLPRSVAGGSHAVQIGSFGAAADAISLKNKMGKKGYPAFIVEADLGKKGLWYRVRIGPYADSAAAKSVQKILAEKEKITGFVSRQ